MDFTPLPPLHNTKETTTSFLAQLERVAALPPKTQGESVAKKSSFNVESKTGPCTVNSWKFREFDYSKKADLMVTHARGLFTTDNTIVARGYDKFFNLGEQAAKLEMVESECSGPYNVSTKENGCIIFVSGLEDGTLLVCSKHSTGEIGDEGLRHFQRGKQEIFKQLQQIGRSPEELARTLFNMNVTAVAELCDDEFEEHVLEYPQEMAGLYLHGLNFNVKEFETYPMEKVCQFAKLWGFKEVSYLTFDTLEETLLFLNAAGEKGVYEGREVEGFVVRCKRNGSTYFFKFKFEQPYLFYRQLREATKALFDPERLRTMVEVVLSYPQYQRITFSYLQFVQKLFEEHPEMIDQFLHDVGVIKVRKAFLRSLGFQDNQGLAALLMDDDDKLTDQLDKLVSSGRFHYFVVTMAPIGCGKTTTCKTLTNLFPEWEHIQNDDCKNAVAFNTKALLALNKLQVVFLDRTNLQRQNRKQLFDALETLRRQHLMPDINIRYIGLNFLKSSMSEETKKLAEKRVLERGDNHQSIRAASNPKGSLAHLENFAKLFRGPAMANGENLPVAVEGTELEGDDKKFSLVINVEVDEEDSSLKNAKIVLEEMHKKFPDIELRDISSEEWNQAFEEAKNYKPTTVKTMSKPKRSAVYYGLNIYPQFIIPYLDVMLKGDETWESMKASGRVQKVFHTTLAHGSSRKGSDINKSKWDDLGRLFMVNKCRKDAEPNEQKRVNFFADIQVEDIVVAEGKLIALKVHLLACFEKVGDEYKEIPAFPSTNEYLHITIGTADAGIAPRMSNVYLLELFAHDVSKSTYQLTDCAAKVIKWDAVFEKLQAFIYFE